MFSAVDHVKEEAGSAGILDMPLAMSEMCRQCPYLYYAYCILGDSNHDDGLLFFLE